MMKHECESENSDYLNKSYSLLIHESTNTSETSNSL